MKAKITKSLIAGLKPGERDQIIWDTEVAGLAIRMTPKGAMSYILKTRVGRGRAASIIKPRLGACREFTPDQARKKARDWKAMAEEGIDPVRAQKTVTELPSVRDLCDKYLADLALAESELERISRALVRWESDPAIRWVAFTSAHSTTSHCAPPFDMFCLS